MPCLAAKSNIIDVRETKQSEKKGVLCVYIFIWKKPDILIPHFMLEHLNPIPKFPSKVLFIMQKPWLLKYFNFAQNLFYNSLCENEEYQDNYSLFSKSISFTISMTLLTFTLSLYKISKK